jgi:hypothetical protein
LFGSSYRKKLSVSFIAFFGAMPHNMNTPPFIHSVLHLLETTLPFFFNPSCPRLQRHAAKRWSREDRQNRCQWVFQLACKSLGKKNERGHGPDFNEREITENCGRQTSVFAELAIYYLINILALGVHRQQ